MSGGKQAAHRVEVCRQALDVRRCASSSPRGGPPARCRLGNGTLVLAGPRMGTGSPCLGTAMRPPAVPGNGWLPSASGAAMGPRLRRRTADRVSANPMSLMSGSRSLAGMDTLHGRRSLRWDACLEEPAPACSKVWMLAACRKSAEVRSTKGRRTTRRRPHNGRRLLKPCKGRSWLLLGHCGRAV